MVVMAVFSSAIDGYGYGYDYDCRSEAGSMDGRATSFWDLIFVGGGRVVHVWQCGRTPRSLVS